MEENPLRLGLGLPREPQPLTLVIFGASGDLTHRKLVPALFSLYSKGSLPRVRIIGVARREWTTEEFRAIVRSGIEADETLSAGPDMRDAFIGSVHYLRAPFESAEGYAAIREASSDMPNRLFYLATPPDAYQAIVQGLRDSGLSRSPDGGFARIVIEKPIGRDLQSAIRLNDHIAGAFSEDQIYRIDHYLGKETVQNIMLMRFGNRIFEPVWNNAFIDHVQIVMAESIGIGHRGPYYEGAGALRDMMQNHMLSLLCLVAMEPPVDLAPDSIHNEKIKVLRSIVPIRGSQGETQSARGQYAQGIVEGARVPGYREEPGVASDSSTETYAALRVQLDSWRWSGVPFFLRTGKRLPRGTTEISIHFKRPPLLLFADRQPGSTPPNVLVFRIQPQEGITMGVNSKIPGASTEMRTVSMDFSYGSAFGDELPDAYERLLLDAMRGDSTLFMRADEVAAAWGFITGIREGWERTGRPELSPYAAGSPGPRSAERLFDEGERRWRRL